jgi:hypothetical protein
MKNPPMSVDDLLDELLSLELAETVAVLRPMRQLL